MIGRFPALRLAVLPPLAPMEAESAEALPAGTGWQFEPKWDGFRCLAFRDGRTVVLQSKGGEPLTRYFPELVMAIASLPTDRFVLDGEIVVLTGGRASYEELLARMHPSARRVAQLSAMSPATFLAFDLLAEGDDALVGAPLSERRKRLEAFFKGHEAGAVHLCPATTKRAEALGWLKALADAGLDGLMAKRRDAPYQPGARAGMVKVKTDHTCECVIAGVRKNGQGEVATLLLGLYDDDGLLHFVGATEPLPEATRASLPQQIAPLFEAPGFTGRGPTTTPASANAAAAAAAAAATSESPKGKPRDFEPLRPVLVCEVRYDRFTADRFRHAPIFLRFRPDKKPARCTFDQVRPPEHVKRGFDDVLGL